MFVVFLLIPYISISFAMETTESYVSKEEVEDEYIWKGYGDKSDTDNTGIMEVKRNDSVPYIVYCFNSSKSLPKNQDNVMYKKIDGSGNEFTKHATKPRLQNKELEEKILSVI